MNRTHLQVPFKWNSSFNDSVDDKSKVIQKLMKRKKGDLEN